MMTMNSNFEGHTESYDKELFNRRRITSTIQLLNSYCKYQRCQQKLKQKEMFMQKKKIKQFSYFTLFKYQHALVNVKYKEFKYVGSLFVMNTSVISFAMKMSHLCIQTKDIIFKLFVLVVSTCSVCYTKYKLYIRC